MMKLKGLKVTIYSEFLPDDNSYRAAVLNKQGLKITESELFAEEIHAMEAMNEYCEATGLVIVKTITGKK